MRVFYSRVSATDGSQKPDRQLVNTSEFDYHLTDYCSGSIPLFEMYAPPILVPPKSRESE
jgi:hypothetical protein